MKVLVTGATGFVGEEILTLLNARMIPWVAAVRKLSAGLPIEKQIVVGDIHGQTSWKGALAGVTAVVHAAGRAHQLKASDDRLFFEVNVEGTRRLFTEAQDCAVSKFVYLSTIKVLGNESIGALTEEAPLVATDAYSESKCRAEEVVGHFQKSVDCFTLRPPLVYGPKAKGYFRQILRAGRKGLPLPLNGIRENRRSFIYIQNLTDAIATCLLAKGSGVYHVADSDPISTGDLMATVAKGFPRSRFFALDPWILNKVLSLPGLRAHRSRLFSSLVLSTEKIRKELQWQAPTEIHLGLAETVKLFLAGQT